ncbi:hypothetical protein BU25DRAFT_453886 [Macroventuria anomochaeta]|uniref:Uncharacterized protein n=1 Tax=Macroventuria anomochaeta TaxID=301207 RepID=A0ACB6SGJ0_9PLEO|nr:uncharacterized protein BU25DRAFT_453886 [Macroventuria anomochaeta]KAF2632695.1 hypothetical protein BU25DRAFT_453886 [Macroventuria anomochaeta]
MSSSSIFGNSAHPYTSANHSAPNSFNTSHLSSIVLLSSGLAQSSGPSGASVSNLHAISVGNTLGSHTPPSRRIPYIRVLRIVVVMRQGETRIGVTLVEVEARLPARAELEHTQCEDVFFYQIFVCHNDLGAWKAKVIELDSGEVLAYHTTGGGVGEDGPGRQAGLCSSSCS